MMSSGSEGIPDCSGMLTGYEDAEWYSVDDLMSGVGKVFGVVHMSQLVVWSMMLRVREPPPGISRFGSVQ